MTMCKSILAAVAVIGLAAPAAAQYPYQPQVPQPAPGQPGYGYYPPQQGYQPPPGRRRGEAPGSWIAARERARQALDRLTGTYRRGWRRTP